MSEKSNEAVRSPELSFQDLFVLKSVIEASTQRGAIKAKELKLVGEVYERLSAFLEFISKQQQVTEEEEEEE